MGKERINLGSVPVDPVTHAGALDAIDRLVTSGKGGFVVTPNVDHIVLAERDVALRRTYHRSSLSLADGQPLTWMARLLGTPIPARVSGSDLIEPLIARAAARGWRVFFFGACDAVSHSFENVPACQSALPGNAINFRPPRRFCNTALASGCVRTKQCL